MSMKNYFLPLVQFSNDIESRFRCPQYKIDFSNNYYGNITQKWVPDKRL